MRLFLTYSGFDLFKLIFPDVSQTDQWTDRPMDGQTDGRTDGQTDEGKSIGPYLIGRSKNLFIKIESFLGRSDLDP